MAWIYESSFGAVHDGRWQLRMDGYTLRVVKLLTIPYAHSEPHLGCSLGLVRCQVYTR